MMFDLLKKYARTLGLPFVVAVIYLFLYVPIIILVLFSFNDAAFPAPFQGFTLKWYFQLFQSAEIWRAFFVSCVVALVSTLLSSFIALSLVYFHFMGGKLRRLLYLFYANVVITEIVLAVALLGFLTYMVVPLGITTLIVGHTVLGIGYIVPLVYNRYLALDPRIVESSLDLGATQTQTFFKITLPLLRPALIAAGLLAFILSFDDFVLSFFCAGSEAQTLSLYIYSMIRSGVSPVVNALSTILLFFSSLLVLLFCYLNVRTKIF